MEERFESEIIEYRVDNLFFSKKDNKNLDMDQLHHYLKGNELYYASYVHELFQGMHLLPNNKLYPTGSFRMNDFFNTPYESFQKCFLRLILVEKSSLVHGI